MRKIQTLKIIPLIIISIIGFTACVEIIHGDVNQVEITSEVPAAAAPAQPAGYTDFPYVDQGSFRIYYEPAVASAVDDAGELVPAGDGSGGYEIPHPEFADFNFSPLQAHIYVARVMDYEGSAEFAPGTIADLHRLIEGASEFERCVPEPPLATFFQECAHQEFVANPAHVALGNGQAVRFVTAYAIQNLAPVDNSTLVYVLQGFTDDGRYYVKAIVELMHAQLEGTGEVPSEIYAAPDLETINAYFDQFKEMFEAAPDEFTPRLEQIDQVMAGLYVVEVP